MEVNNENYQDFKANSGISLLAFKATWCGPCRTLSPLLTEIGESDASIVVGLVDVDSNPELSAEYSIRNVPTTFILKDGEIVGKIIGAKSKTDILAEIERVA